MAGVPPGVPYGTLVVLWKLRRDPDSDVGLSLDCGMALWRPGSRLGDAAAAACPVLRRDHRSVCPSAGKKSGDAAAAGPVGGGIEKA